MHAQAYSRFLSNTHIQCKHIHRIMHTVYCWERTWNLGAATATNTWASILIISYMRHIDQPTHHIMHAVDRSKRRQNATPYIQCWHCCFSSNCGNGWLHLVLHVGVVCLRWCQVVALLSLCTYIQYNKAACILFRTLIQSVCALER